MPAPGLVQVLLRGPSALNDRACAALTLCYRVVPGVGVRWQAAALGALLGAFGLLAVRWPLTWALVHLTSYSAYGVVGVLLLIMTWLYVVSNILMFGAALAAIVNQARPERAVRTTRPART